MLDKERENYKQKMRDIEGKGTNATAKQTELLLNFEKERAKWEHEKSYLINQKDDAQEAQQRLEKKVELLLRENEKLKNDVRANRKNMYQATANTSTNQGALIGANILGKLGSFGAKGGPTGQTTTSAFGLNFGKEGGITERSGYGNTSGVGVDKSFQSSSGGGLLGYTSHGAVGGVGGTGHPSGLDSSLMNNVLSTPSSEKSGRNSSISPNEPRRE